MMTRKQLTALVLLALLVVGVAFIEVNAHQQAAFPGHNANQPPPTHDQAHAQQATQQPAANAQQPNQAQFGGDAVHDEGHIKEHLEGKVDPTANMTPAELQFHYFNMHDLDKNSRLDGTELIKAITHFHQENPTNQHKDANAPPPLPTEVELEQMIDSILKEDDYNNDGFIDYSEFLKAQKQREEQARLHSQASAQQQKHQQQPPPPTR